MTTFHARRGSTPRRGGGGGHVKTRLMILSVTIALIIAALGGGLLKPLAILCGVHDGDL